MIPGGPEPNDAAATHPGGHRHMAELLAGVDVRHVHLDHGQTARLDRVAERLGVVRQRTEVRDAGRVAVVLRGEEPADELAFAVRVAPTGHVPDPARVFVDPAHDLLDRLPAVALGVAPAERAEVRPEQVQDLHRPPISSRTARTVASGTSSTTRGAPTSSSSTKRTPPEYFLSSRNAPRIASTPGNPPSGSNPSIPTIRRCRCTSSGPPIPSASESLAANTIPTATASPCERPAYASSRSSACASVWP